MQLSIVLDTLANNKKPYAADNNQKNKTSQYSCQKYFRRIRSNIWFTRCNFVASDTNCFSSLFSVACKFLKLCHFISKLLALLIHFSRLRTKIDQYLEDLPQADFGGVFETISSIGKEKSRNANYVNWSNPFCSDSTHYFNLEPYHPRVLREFFYSLIKSTFLVIKGQLCL